MKYIKAYESFNVNETLDMFTMPVDPIKASLDVYKEIGNAIGNKISDITNSLRKAAKSDVSKIADFMKKTFGTTQPEFTKENAERLYKALGLDSIKENFQRGENLAIQLCGRVKQLLGINIYAWAGIPLAVVLGGMLAGSTAAVFGVLAASWSLLFVFTKIMQLFGYGDDNTGVEEIGEYDYERDIRNR